MVGGRLQIHVGLQQDSYWEGIIWFLSIILYIFIHFLEKICVFCCLFVFYFLHTNIAYLYGRVDIVAGEEHK